MGSSSPPWVTEHGREGWLVKVPCAGAFVFNYGDFGGRIIVCDPDRLKVICVLTKRTMAFTLGIFSPLSLDDYSPDTARLEQLIRLIEAYTSGG
jgi:hypothetical protein